MEKKNLEINWGSLWRIFGMLLLVSVFYFSKDIIIILILSVVISSALDPVVSFFESKKFPRILSTLLIFILLIGSLSFLFYIIAPVVLFELGNLMDYLKESQPSFFGLGEASEILNVFTKNIGRWSNLLFSGSTSLSEVASRFLGNLALALSGFILSFYLTVDRDGVEKFLRAILPPAYEEKVLDVYFRTRYKIGKWLQGQIFLSVSVGAAVSLGLWILGVEHYLLLGILAAILEIVPFVGPILSGAVAVLIALSQSFTLAIYALVLFIIIQQLEAHLLTPVFMRLAIDLHPVVSIVALLLGWQLSGVIGMILAIPAAVLVQEIINNWSVSKIKRKALF